MEFLNSDPGDEAQPHESLADPGQDQAPAAPKETLADLLASLTSIERRMDDENFDPASIIGDITENREALAKKVDAIDYVISEFEAYADRTEARAERFLRRAKTAKNRAASLRLYLLSMMKLHGFEKLTGVDRAVHIKVHHDPKLVVKRQANEDDLLSLSEDLVEVVPRSYAWNRKALKNWMLKHPQDPMTADIAELEYNEKVVFDDLDKPAVATKKGKKK